MRKVLLISSLSLALAGCAAQQAQEPSVQVRDLSASRADSSSSEYTVQAGDTLYGIAWRHNMDHRDLAQLNRIGPPYRIEPGQRLVLSGNGPSEAQASSGGRDGNTTRQSGVVATGLGTTDETDGSADWLRPDDEAIERNRRLTARPLGDAVGDPDAEGPSETAMLGAAAVSGSDDGPGPVYNFESPGADGSLDERDIAERRALEAERAASEAARETESEQVAIREPEIQEAPASETRQSPPDAAASRDEREEEAPRQADAGASVAGDPASEERSGRTYTPVVEVPWQWPVEGDVVGSFGEGGSITAGIDIAGQKGQPVKAAGPGIVVYAGSGVRGYGNLILLKHNDQFLSAYAHNDSLRVNENDVVEAGETIATMGDSDAEDTRLHFEVRKDGQPQNPLDFLPSR